MTILESAIELIDPLACIERLITSPSLTPILSNLSRRKGTRILRHWPIDKVGISD